MKSLGNTLKAAREEQGIELENVFRKINISRHYLEALEDENFEIFPAEAYLLGFLRNYSSYLGLDPDKMVGKFRNYKLNEQPTPIKELVGPPKGTLKKRLVLWTMAAAVLAAALIITIPRLGTVFKDFRTERAQRIAERTKEAPNVEIRPNAPQWEGAVRPGDILVLEDDFEEQSFAVSIVDNHLKLDAGSGSKWTMLLGEDVSIPNSNGVPRWLLSLKDLGLSDGGAILSVEVLADALTDEFEIKPPRTDTERQREAQVIVQARSPENFTLDIEFRGYGFFRYKSDNQDPKEWYYVNGDSLRLDARRTLTLWTSNAGVVYAAMNGKDVSLGRLGEVVVWQIRWALSEDSRNYDLVMLPLY